MLFFLVYPSLKLASIVGSWFHLIQGRREVYTYICFNNANRVILIFWKDLENVYLKLLSKFFNSSGVFFMDRGRVPQLVLFSCFGLFSSMNLIWWGCNLIFCLMLPSFFLKPDTKALWQESLYSKFQLFELPVEDIARTLFGHELQYSAVSHLGAVLQT